MSMEKELLNTFDKKLLLKDLCARLPYGLKVKCEKYSFPVTILYGGNIDEVKFIETGGIENIYAIKPYLFPLSSMTEEQKESSPFEPSLLNAFINGHISLFEDEELNIDDLNRLYDWLNKNHFDYRGLIEKRLAIDATGLNIY